jgi:hypothetical protein
MISRLTLLLKGKVLLAIVGTLLVAGGGTTIAVAAAGAKVSIPLVSRTSSSVHQDDSSSTASTDSDGQDSSHHDGQQADGAVSSINSGQSSFKVTPEHGADISVVVNAQTEFKGELRDFTGLKVGLQVQVTGTKQPDGSLLATRVEGQDEHELTGTIMSLDAAKSSFVLKLAGGTTRTIEVSANTEFEGDGDFQRFSDLKVGQSVQVEGNLQSNGTLAATKVRREDNASSDGSDSLHGSSSAGGNSSTTPTPTSSDP